jgi:hypothetical protein
LHIRQQLLFKRNAAVEQSGRTRMLETFFRRHQLQLGGVTVAQIDKNVG